MNMVNLKRYVAITLIGIVMAVAMPLAYCVEYGEEWENAPTVPRPYNPSNWNFADENLSVAPFSDVPESHWAYADILYCRGKGWVGGYSDNTFKPDSTITKAEVITIIDNYMGLNTDNFMTSSFIDVNNTAWYAPYIEAGKELFPQRSELQGHNKIAPEEPISREDIVYILVNVLNYDRYLETADYTLLNSYSDSEDVYSSIRPYMAVALEYGLIVGYDQNTIKPHANLSRAEFASLLRRTSKIADQL